MSNQASWGQIFDHSTNEMLLVHQMLGNYPNNSRHRIRNLVFAYKALHKMAK